MNNYHKFLRVILLLFVSFMTITSCSSKDITNSGETLTIKIAALPVLDTLPIYVAEQEGYFKEHNVNVKLIPVSSAPKRDELISSGQADGMINEVVSTIFYNRERTQVQIVRYARTASHDSAIFRILSSGKSEIRTIDQLKGVAIGVSKGTVIEYLTDRMLQAEGFSPDEINLIAVPDIAQRMALLGSGELKAAMLPDPLASLVMGQGANLVLEDSAHPQFSHSVYAFRTEFIQEYPEAIEGFLAAIEDAVNIINANPEEFKTLLSEKELIPQILSAKFPIPQFVIAGIPSQEQWDDVSAWILDEGLEVGNANYQNSVTGDFLP